MNKSTRGVVWEDVTKIPTNEASTTGLEGSAASPTPVLGIVLPPVTAGVVSSTPPISDTSENASFSNKVTHAPTPTSPFDIPDEIPAATDDTLVGVSGLTATTVTVAAAANIASAKEMSNPQPETDAEAWARVEREAAVASRAETVEKLIRKSARIKQEVGEHVAQDSRTRAQSKGIASTTNPTKLIKAAKRSRMNFNMAVVGPGGIGKSTLLQSLFEDFVPTVHTMVHPRSMVAGEEVSGGVTALSFLGSLEASNDEGDPVVCH